MAISIDVVFKDIQVPEAYINIGSIVIEQDKKTITFSAMHRARQGADIFAGNTYTAPYELDGLNPFKQAYAHLKTLPEFQDAIDC